MKLFAFCVVFVRLYAILSIRLWSFSASVFSLWIYIYNPRLETPMHRSENLYTENELSHQTLQKFALGAIGWDLIHKLRYQNSGKIDRLATRRLVWRFHIPHNTLCLPPKFCINHCFQMPLGHCILPRAFEHINSLCKNLGGKHSVLWGK